MDDSWHLIEDIPIRRFILAKPESGVDTLLVGQFVKITAYEDQEEAARLMKKYDPVALPVTDSEGILIGIVTIDDIMNVLEEEVPEDFHKAAAVSPLAMSYVKSGIFFL